MAKTLVNLMSGQTFLHKLKNLEEHMPELTVTKDTATVVYNDGNLILAHPHYDGETVRVEESAFKVVMTSGCEDAMLAVVGKLRRSL